MILLKKNMRNLYNKHRGFEKFVTGLFISIITLALVSCELENAIGFESHEAFIKIYDFNLWGGIYNMKDAVQDEDGGYTLLANLENAPYIMSVDKNGDFSWDTWDYSAELPNYTPVTGLSVFNNEYYFFAESYAYDTKTVVLMKLSESKPYPVIVAEFGEINEIIKPLSSIQLDNELILLMARPMDQQMSLLMIDYNGVVKWEKSIEYSADVEYYYPVKDNRFHFLRKINEDTFYCNTYSGDNIINMKINKDGTILEETSYDHGPITSLAVFSNSTAFSFPIGDIYGIQTSKSDFQTENGIDFSNHSVIERILINDKEYAAFSANARDNMIMLKIFDPVSNNSIYKKYYGQNYAYNTGGLLPTADGGLLLYGNAYVLGRQGRVLLIKIAKEELVDMVK